MRKLILLIVIVNSSLIIAQQMSEMSVIGKAEYLPNEIINTNVRDTNGQICAGLIIQTDLDGLSFDSNNGIVKRNDKPGEYFLFLSANERKVQVYKDGYTPLEIILYDHGINLESGKVWKLKVTGDKVLDEIPVNFVVTPSDAQVKVDNKIVDIKATIKLSKGNHDLKIEKQGFKTIKTQINVSESSIHWKYQMQGIEAVLVTLKSIPTEANIYIDSFEKGRTDKQLFLLPGSYKVRILKSGYIASEREILVNEVGSNEFSFNLQKNSVTLNLNLSPADVKVLINKEDYSNRKSIELPPGNYQIEISREGYKSTIDYLELNLGHALSKNYTLEKLTGTLQLTVQPINAKVELKKDNKIIDTWKGSTQKTGLLIGIYQIVVSSTGYDNQTKKITIKENQITDDEIILTKSSVKSNTYSYHNLGCPSSILHEGKTYHTVKIGDQCWLKENLDVGEMIDGDEDQKDNVTIEKYCYDDEPANCNIYGGLYQWNEAMQYTTTNATRGICPEGWHIPTITELRTLSNNVNRNTTVLMSAGQKIIDVESTNRTGFSALFAGYRKENGYFTSIGKDTYFWSSTEESTSRVFPMRFNYDSWDINFGFYHKISGYSVRCIKN